MEFSIHLCDGRHARRLGAWLVLCIAFAYGSDAALAQSSAKQPSVGQAAQDQPVTSVPATVAVGGSAASLSKRQRRQAEDAYLAGAKKLKRNDLIGAEQSFKDAQKLDPTNRTYAQAIAVAREHRVTELMQQAGKAQMAGQRVLAEGLLAEAREIAPDDPNVAQRMAALLSGSTANANPASVVPESLAKLAQELSGGSVREPWVIRAPQLSGAVHLEPSNEVKSFHLRGVVQDVMLNVARAYGIRAVFDESVERKQLRFDMENVRYEQAMATLGMMGHVFTVPVDAKSMIVAKNDSSNRERLERQMEETIYLPEATPEQLTEMANVIRTLFELQKVSIINEQGSVVVRAPEAILLPMNRTLRNLMDDSGEVMVEVKMYEVDTTNSHTAGATIPTSAGVYNVDAAAAALVSANSTLVSEALAQGIISSTDSTLTVAGELIASGLVTSSLLSSTVGVVGGGALMTGITETGSVAFNLGLNSTETRALDDVQMRVSDRQEATFREGSKYPIMSSSYNTGLSSSTSSALSSAKINGVSVASLLAQYTGSSTGTTIPQVTYEDLGVTLTTTPWIEKSGRINLKLDMKIEALSGSTNDGNPVLESRQFKSVITVAEGESALLVSNVTKSEVAAMSGIPGLSDLPGFEVPNAQNGEKDTVQLVVVVTPHVVRRRSNLLAGPQIMVPTQSQK
jgi:Flp pilus assembly secretin CpaC